MFKVFRTNVERFATFVFGNVTLQLQLIQAEAV